MHYAFHRGLFKRNFAQETVGVVERRPVRPFSQKPPAAFFVKNIPVAAVKIEAPVLFFLKRLGFGSTSHDWVGSHGHEGSA
jgi:hypothetical protein